jgi:hypothetical protein
MKCEDAVAAALHFNGRRISNGYKHRKGQGAF